MISAWTHIGFAYCFLILTGISAFFYKKTNGIIFRFLGGFTGFITLLLTLLALLSFENT